MIQDRPFEPTGATQNAAMDGSAKTITLDAAGPRGSTVYLANIGTSTIFIRLDGTTPTTANALALPAASAQVFTRPQDSTTVKAIGSSGSTLYVTPGRGA